MLVDDVLPPNSTVVTTSSVFLLFEEALSALSSSVCNKAPTSLAVYRCFIGLFAFVDMAFVINYTFIQFLLQTNTLHMFIEYIFSSYGPTKIPAKPLSTLKIRTNAHRANPRI